VIKSAVDEINRRRLQLLDIFADNRPIKVVMSGWRMTQQQHGDWPRLARRWSDGIRAWSECSQPEDVLVIVMLRYQFF